MAELEYFLVCRSVASDIENNELSFHGVLEDFYPIALPTVIPRIVAISAWRADADEAKLDLQAILRVFLPSETEGVDFAMNLAPGRMRHRALQALYDVPVDIPGDLRCEVMLNGKHQATHIITIHPAPPQKSGLKTE
jgi:hypothetical protein